MATNKIVLRSVEEFMTDFTPVYTALYPLLIGGKSVQYDAEVGDVKFRRLDTVGDIRAKHITPKDTEIRQVNVTDGSKQFKKYFLATQYVQSSWQDRQGDEDVVSQVLDEHHVQADELLLLGEGTSAADVVNAGLYWSNDPNYTLEVSYEVPLTDRLLLMHAKIVTNATKANQRSGRKALVFYGALALAQFNSLYAASTKAFKAVLAEVLTGYSFIELPAAVTPASANGWMILNLDQLKTHYTLLPSVNGRGLNEEKMYLWTNFVMGSLMVEVLTKDAVIRQPITFAV